MIWNEQSIKWIMTDSYKIQYYIVRDSKSFGVKDWGMTDSQTFDVIDWGMAYWIDR